MSERSEERKVGVIGMKREFTLIIELDEEGYFVATVPELHGCQIKARSFDELMERVKEAITKTLSESYERKHELEKCRTPNENSLRKI